RRLASLGLAARASVTVSALPGTVLPSESCTATCSGGEIATFASPLARERVTKDRRVGVPFGAAPAAADPAGPTARSRWHAWGTIASRQSDNDRIRRVGRPSTVWVALPALQSECLRMGAPIQPRRASPPVEAGAVSVAAAPQALSRPGCRRQARDHRPYAYSVVAV